MTTAGTAPRLPVARTVLARTAALLAFPLPMATNSIHDGTGSAHSQMWLGVGLIAAQLTHATGSVVRR